MKTKLKLLIISLVLVLINFGKLEAQNDTPQTKISYDVNVGPVYPIEGTSEHFKGFASVNDTTGVFESLNFEVDLNSFTGIHAGYLGWLANSWNNPDLKFRSNKITKVGDHWKVEGILEFRRRYAYLQINMTSKEINNDVVLDGNFTMNTHDYYNFATPSELVATWIPFNLQMVFDKPTLKKQEVNVATVNSSS
ncbi:hypothetical protein [Gaetbulibacter aestuarii]|uniref:Lipid/polyisoprenoid-binding YceI-like domain-containing protein n=1 Tax=Gaetbulibacter aestuarii TaxID=1502358 RepID=A0ABW7N1I8_9FLAO